MYSVCHTGKCFIDEGVVKKVIGVVDGPFATRNGDQHANATLVISVGKLVAFEDGFSGAPDYEIETSYFGY